MEVFEPSDPLLKKYVHSIYFYDRGDSEVCYTAYPSANVAVGLSRNVVINCDKGTYTIDNSPERNYRAFALNRLFQPVTVHYLRMVDQVAINFTPLGFAIFAKWNYSNPDGDYFVFSTWDGWLKDLLDSVFSSCDGRERLQMVEEFLLRQYSPLEDEQMLTQAIEILSDAANGIKLPEIAVITGVHYKYLYRSFMRYIGCSPAHYRKIVRFRKALYSKIDQGDTARFVEICYENDYADHSHFIKQFRELTGENPKKFFGDISAFGKHQVVFKYS